MKKAIALLIVLCVGAVLFAVDPTPITGISEGSVTQASVNTLLKIDSKENQYIWVGFTDEEVEKQEEDASQKAVQGNLPLSMTSGTTASNDTADGTLYISAQFAYRSNAKVTLSGLAMSGTGTGESPSTEYLGYSVSKKTDDNSGETYLTVEESNNVDSAVGTKPAIEHSGTEDWMQYYSVPLLITTASLDGKTATEFTGTITATVESV